MIESKEKVQKK